MPSSIKPTVYVRRALSAVKNGEVVRTYRKNGNHLEGPDGVGKAMLAALDRHHLIKDGEAVGGSPVFGEKYIQILTKGGEAVLESGNDPR